MYEDNLPRTYLLFIIMIIIIIIIEITDVATELKVVNMSENKIYYYKKQVVMMASLFFRYKHD